MSNISTIEWTQVESYTRKEWLTLVTIGCVQFTCAICISLQAPFYPAEAESKGATATEYGLVLGSFELVAFLSSPVFGHYVHKIRPRRLLLFGLFVNAIAVILFGFLHFVHSRELFIILSFMFRIIGSLGTTGALIAAFSLTATEFSNSIATTFATLEVFYGLGYIMGPPVGGILYNIGGFAVPFFVIGGATLIIAIVVGLNTPKVEGRHLAIDNQYSMRKLLKIPAVFLDAASICSTSLSIGFYIALLEPHLRDFELPSLVTPFMFIISGVVYTCISPLIGILCDKYVKTQIIIFCGCLLISASFILVGPLPYSGIPKTLALCIIGLILQGIGNGCVISPTLIDMLRSAAAEGFPDDISTFGLVAGLWMSSFALGAFVGPTVAGFLYDLVGFANGTLLVIVCLMLLSFILIGFIYYK